MPLPKNRLSLAVAGSGKTTDLVKRALASKGHRVLLTTYTRENVAQIESCIVGMVGCIPPHITVMSWYTLLLRDGVRPYQRDVFPKAPRVQSVFLEKVPDSIGRPTKEQSRYFLTNDRRVYRDRTSDLVVLANQRSGGAVVKRLEDIYAAIFIDEIQDISGYDLDLLELLFRSRIAVNCSGDVRQATYHTNDNARHKQYRGARLVDWFELQRRAGLLEIETANTSHRCNESICAFANAIFPEMAPSEPCKCSECRAESVPHTGVHFVLQKSVREYIECHQPRLLRYSASSKVALQEPIINFGECKGREYDHVLLFPTKGIETYLKTWDPADIGDREKFYVAVTRARHSVAIVVKAVPKLPEGQTPALTPQAPIV